MTSATASNLSDPRPGLWTACASVLACYGPLALIVALSSLGVSLALNVHIWAAAIVGFATLSTLILYRRCSRLGRSGPVVLSAAGTGLVALSTYGEGLLEGFGVNARLVEAIGFAALIAAALWARR